MPSATAPAFFGRVAWQSISSQPPYLPTYLIPGARRKRKRKEREKEEISKYSR
jgi:hypothetical protein